MQERERLGRELHDCLGQALASAYLLAETAQTFLARGDADQATAQLAHLAEVTQAANADVRDYLLGLKTTLPLWLAGLYFYFFSPDGRRYRLLGWMALVSFLLFWVAQARGYYTAPIYPMLFAAGAVWFEQWFATLPRRRARLAQGMTWALAFIGGAIALSLGPYWPVKSPQWQIISGINTDLKEEIGWPELVQTVAGIYDGLPAEARSGTSILAGNYGVAGAIDLYGSADHLPRVIRGVNSYWQRGYGDPPPQTIVVVGLPRQVAVRFFADCEVAGHVTNAFGVKNEETVNDPDTFVCRMVRLPWPQLWEQIRSFG